MFPNRLREDPFGVDTLKAICRLPGFLELGKEYRRREITASVRDRFVELGGDARTTTDRVARVFKGCVTNKSIPFEPIPGIRGGYRFLGYDEETAVTDERPETAAGIPSGTDSTPNLEPELDYGNGGSYEVYAWCLPLYASVDSQFPVKIGRAGSEGFNRRFSDFAAHLPEYPRLLVRIRCQENSEARDWEILLHRYFKNRGCKIDTLPGDEWFRTNRDEVQRAIELLNPNLPKRI